jgi:hypothetical protein
LTWYTPFDGDSKAPRRNARNVCLHLGLVDVRWYVTAVGISKLKPC